MDPKNGMEAVSFENDSYSFMKIASIGYRDYNIYKSGDFVTVNHWNCLYFVPGGSGSFTVNGKTYSLQKGDFFFIRPGEQIAYCTDDNTLKYYWIALSEEHAEEIARVLKLTRDCPVRPAKYARRVEWIFNSVLDWGKPTSKSYFTAVSALMQILSAECDTEPLPISVERHKILAENIKQTIDLNFQKPQFSVNDVAQLLYISHSLMSRVFKEVMGITPVAYLVHIRLRYASELLYEKDLPVKELAAESGFSDAGYFMKQFKKKFGVTVREYRASKRK